MAESMGIKIPKTPKSKGAVKTEGGEEDKGGFVAERKESVSEKLKRLVREQGENSQEVKDLRAKLKTKRCGMHDRHTKDPSSTKACKYGDRCLYGHFDARAEAAVPPR